MMEPKKKKSKKKMIIIIVIVAVVLIVGGFCAFRFFARGPQPPQQPQQGDASMTEPMYPPGEGQQYVTGPNGEQPPAPPTRPPQN